MSFDPDKYLEKKKDSGSFDPDAYLKKRQNRTLFKRFARACRAAYAAFIASWRD